MKTKYVGMEWLEPLVAQANAEYSAQQMQIETLFAEGMILAILLSDKSDAEREAALMQSCFIDQLTMRRFSPPPRQRAPDADADE